MERKRFSKSHLIAIDSDGCVFDGMNMKQRLAFIPTAIAEFGLEEHAELYTKTAEEVNLFSALRGCNRFQALWCSLSLCKKRANARLGLPDLSALESFITSDLPLSNATLQTLIANNPSPILVKSLIWSENTNQKVAEFSSQIPIFKDVRESLKSACNNSDIMVCSAASNNTLEDEWEKAELTPYVNFIAGQEYGPKHQQILNVSRLGSFEKDKILMIGDALSDLNAANNAGVRFYPIIPGSEEVSWTTFVNTVLPDFLKGKYSIDNQNDFVQKLNNALQPCEIQIPS